MMTIVKLGGSLYGRPELMHWLQTLAQAAQRHTIVIVPGGGPFADQVRAAQKIHAFDDEAAHHMALLAMKQFGLLLCGLETACRPCQNTIMPPAHTLSVWLPDDVLLQDSRLPASWQITSDSIALWLAAQTEAAQLLLIKCCQTDSQSIHHLARKQVLDQGFARLYAQHPVRTRILHYQQYAQLPAALTQDYPQLILP